MLCLSLNYNLKSNNFVYFYTYNNLFFVFNIYSLKTMKYFCTFSFSHIFFDSVFLRCGFYYII